jgi:DNA-binding helix-hairpin-helix protein with protein kinase domain
MNGTYEVTLATIPERMLAFTDADRIGGGSQGMVYAPAVEPSIAIKLYHHLDNHAGDRLEAMRRIAQPGDFEIIAAGTKHRHKQLAWPAELVCEPHSRRVVGYTMPRFPAGEFLRLDSLWDFRVRRAAIPQFTWLFLLSVAENLATLTTMVHERGLVLGDVRDANFVFSSTTALVSMLDCDSMPVTDPQTDEHFPCSLWHADYAAPELWEAPIPPRSQATDNFALAVLISRLLLAGDHPFAGYPALAADEDDEESGQISQNIRAGRSYLVAPGEVELADGTVGPEVLPPALLELARQSFASGLRDPARRPTAVAWRDALRAACADVEDCPAYPERHSFSKHLWSCPWCRLGEGGYDPFPAAPLPIRTPETLPGASLHIIVGVLTLLVAVAVLVAFFATHLI